ncbi:MAG: bifunctional methylenetetrahydrofolate dehydrogenase/methenyltetrahydrofolate cyclohydrolase FolD [Pseudoflavonifractor sp.]|nr:bifunctional methylenetetrahydrofolate dehydrogenase/methenyltetrahydrofolate cyclohydrolase FolD [Pseudoflavonifractor sp.]
MTLLDGKALAAKVKEKVRAQAALLPRKPGLAVILVGNDPASRVYVTSKRKDCETCDIYSEEYALLESTTQEDLLELVAELNGRANIDGILVQLPLPGHLDEAAILEAIAPEKDVDGFHPVNAGNLLIGRPGFLPCTPAGVMEMLDEYHIDLAGKRAVVVGRSNIVGKPMALLLLRRDATVTLCHSKTHGLGEICRQADILVSAVGRRGIITGEMVKKGAAVVDVAMNRDEAGKLCGDVEFAAASEKAAWITPVPGGVGPMTRAMLMKNTLLAAQKRQKNS